MYGANQPIGTISNEGSESSSQVILGKNNTELLTYLVDSKQGLKPHWIRSHFGQYCVNCKEILKGL